MKFFDLFRRRKPVRMIELEREFLAAERELARNPNHTVNTPDSVVISGTENRVLPLYGAIGGADNRAIPDERMNKNLEELAKGLFGRAPGSSE
ncbi:hypothetical protein D9M68_561670 [compost metagenome]